jgi:hypothetical protein
VGSFKPDSGSSIVYYHVFWADARFAGLAWGWMCRNMINHKGTLISSSVVRRHRSHPPKLAFRKCPSCGTRWVSREAFLRDPRNKWNGYQENLGGRIDTSDGTGYAVFTHMARGCGTSIIIPVCELGIMMGCPYLGQEGGCSCMRSKAHADGMPVSSCGLESDRRAAMGVQIFPPR